ncbi:aminotransferase class V-fold PLP-dependent enzyme [Acidobacteriota bacterium]
MMTKTEWDLRKDLEVLRHEFPVLNKCVYLISNSLGAVPKKAREYLLHYYSLWATEGVSAWKKEWWDLARKTGNQIATLLSADQDEITMMPHATHSHWVALSTKFKSTDRKRTKVVITDNDFPSSMYAVRSVSRQMGWEVDTVECGKTTFLDVEDILERIDERTLFVATSHVYFKSAQVQDIAAIATKARRVGALTLIDGYHAPGCYPVELKALNVDFYVGGCLKWLCGGPGTAFLYVRPELASTLEPGLTGWFAHRSPFTFSEEMEFTSGSYRFMSGTPPVPCLYTALAGLEAIEGIGIKQIREKSTHQTNLIIRRAKERNFMLFTPEKSAARGGAVSVSLPHAFQVKQALEAKGVKVDFRKGKVNEPDVIRIGPHFYTKDEEIEILFDEIDMLYKSEEYKKFSDTINHVT